MSRPLLAARSNALATVTWLAAVMVAAIYGVFFFVRLRHNIGAINWTSDYSSPFTMTESIAQGGNGGHTVLSTYGMYLGLWFGLLTEWLPFHRELWEGVPIVVFLATALTVSWCVAQFATRRAAILAALIITVCSPWTMAFVLGSVAHNTTYLATALLGAYVIWLMRRDDRQRAVTISVPLLSGLALGLCIASDLLVSVTGVVPLAVTALAIVLARPAAWRRVAGSILATLAVSVPVALITTAIMHAQGYVTVPTPSAVDLAPLSDLYSHVRWLIQGLQLLFGGYLGQGLDTGDMNSYLTPIPGGQHAAIGIACDLVTAAAFAALIFCGLRASRTIFNRTARTPAELSRQLHIVFWASSALVACGSFVLSTRAGLGHASYYATTILSLAAVLPLAMRPGSVARTLVPAGACVFFVAGLIGLTSHYLSAIEPPISKYASRIVQLAEANDATAGYAGYRDASSLTWSSHDHVFVRPLFQCEVLGGVLSCPLFECPNPAGAEMCPFFLNRVPSWYVPEERRTFLLVDRADYISVIPAGLGRPVAAYLVGSIGMLIYPYDIASRLGPPPT